MKANQTLRDNLVAETYSAWSDKAASDNVLSDVSNRILTAVPSIMEKMLSDTLSHALLFAASGRTELRVIASFLPAKLAFGNVPEVEVSCWNGTLSFAFGPFKTAHFPFHPAVKDEVQSRQLARDALACLADNLDRQEALATALKEDGCPMLFVTWNRNTLPFRSENN